MAPRLPHRLIALALALVVVACGGDDAGSDGASSSTSGSSSAPEGGSTDGVADGTEASAGCGTEPDVAPIGDGAGSDVAATIATPTGDRVYRLARPAEIDPEEPVPLVLNLHGAGSNAQQASIYGDVPRRATDRGWIVVTPEARDGRWEISGEGDDADFLHALVDDVAARYCVDLRRVHVIGMSLGAWKAAVTACGDPDRFASVALVTVEVFPGTCAPMAAVAFHGTDDAVAAYGRGGRAPDPGGPNPGITGTLDNMDRWAANGRCDPTPELSDIGEDVVLHDWSGCADGVDVQLYTIEGGGHTWPGAEVVLGPADQTTTTIDATEIALDHFAAHPRPER